MAANSNYLNTTYRILKYGNEVETRNSKVKRLTNVMTTFYDTPLVTVRKTAWKNALREMEWFLSGSSYIDDLHPSVRHWWEPWANDSGIIANNYGDQFRYFGTWHYDQIEGLVEGVKSHPYSRRNVITTWHTGDMNSPETPITNCHGTTIQVFGRPSDIGTYIDMTMYQRSGDFLLGVQHNWIQYWAFLLWLARETDTRPGNLTWIGGDVHIYEEHAKVAEELAASAQTYYEDYSDRPEMVISKDKGEFKAEDFSIKGKIKEPIVKGRLVMVV